MVEALRYKSKGLGSIYNGVIGIFFIEIFLHILRRNCLLQRVIERKMQGGIEVTGRQGRRRRMLLDDVKDKEGYSNLKEETLDCTVWKARFGRGFGPFDCYEIWKPQTPGL
jgi:hypothetical protein